MKSVELLDDDFNLQIQEYLMEQEGIEWEGEPKPKFSLAFFEADAYYDAMTGPVSILTFILVGIVAACSYFYTIGSWIGFSLSIILGVFLIILPDLIRHQRKKNTKYAFTNNRVFFQLWRWGKKSIHVIDLADVREIRYEVYKDKSGIIHFLPKKPFGFYTHDFVAGERRFYPTFEMIPEVIELHQTLNKLIVERTKRKAIEVTKLG